jgi:hypothetical protein
MLIRVLSIAIMIFFFLPLISCDESLLGFNNGISGLEISKGRGSEIPAKPVVYLLLVIPFLLLMFSLTEYKYFMSALVCLVGLGTWGLLYYLEYKKYENTSFKFTIFTYLSLAFYLISLILCATSSND